MIILQQRKRRIFYHCEQWTDQICENNMLSLNQNAHKTVQK